MYQPYPCGGRSATTPPRPPTPPSVRTAVKLMYAGAVVSAVSLIVGLVDIGGLKGALRASHPGLSAGQVNATVDLFVVSVLASGIIGIGLWLWMAWANGRGRNWARVTGTVFFAIETIELLSTAAAVNTVIGEVLTVLTWLIGLAAVVMLWRRQSRPYFRPSPEYRR